MPKSSPLKIRLLTQKGSRIVSKGITFSRFFLGQPLPWTPIMHDFFSGEKMYLPQNDQYQKSCIENDPPLLDSKFMIPSEKVTSSTPPEHNIFSVTLCQKMAFEIFKTRTFEIFPNEKCDTPPVWQLTLEKMMLRTLEHYIPFLRC